MGGRSARVGVCMPERLGMGRALRIMGVPFVPVTSSVHARPRRAEASKFAIGAHSTDRASRQRLSQVAHSLLGVGPDRIRCSMETSAQDPYSSREWGSRLH